MSTELQNKSNFEIVRQGAKISSALHMLRSQHYPPDAKAKSAAKTPKSNAAPKDWVSSDRSLNFPLANGCLHTWEHLYEEYKESNTESDGD